MMQFDFDHWADLARRDPPAYFHARERAIASFIDEHPAPQAQRLWEIQAQIDCVRALSGSPRHAMHELSVMLGEHLSALQLATDRLLTLSDDLGRSLGDKGTV